MPAILISVLNRNKDFLREVLSGTKELLPINKVKRVNMPPFDELSVKALWPDMMNHEEFMKFFPSKFPAGRLPDRTYFFNIMNTVMEDYVTQIVKHANTVRATKTHNAEAA